MAYCRPSADSAVSVPTITVIHNLDFQGYIYVEIRPLIQSLGIFLESLYNKQIAYVYSVSIWDAECNHKKQKKEKGRNLE